MGKFFYNLRYYSFDKDQYKECMSKVFVNNLNSLRQANNLVVILAICFAIFPIVIENFLLGKTITFFNMAIYFITALIAFVFSIYLNYKMQTGEVSNKFIYIFITLFYINIMAFGIYLCVWLYTDHIAAFYLCIMICSLLMFINPAVFNFCLILIAMAALIICSFIVKETDIAVMDAFNTAAAGVLSLFFSWHITKLRLGMEMSANMLEDERNKYLNQSTIDELTQLNNRRDFMATFKRYLSNYRTSDDYLCVAISDIDFFKNYNDHYGHPQGDECLRGVGKVFATLRDTMGVYVARVGGEEFAMLWFEKDASHVNAVVSYMASLIRSMKMPHEKSKVNEFVTMSVGVYVERLGSDHADVETLYELADSALYAAKGGGRNCAIVTGRNIEQYKITPPA